MSVPVSLVEGSATAGLDYVASAPDTLNFAPGVTELSIDAPVFNELVHEDTEYAQLVLGSPTGATLAKGTGELTILDNDPQPKMAIAHVDQAEGTGETSIFMFVAKLSNPSSKVITMTTYTMNLSATGGPNCALIGVDYVSRGPMLITFKPGETVKPIAIKVCGDNKVEQDEHFALPLNELTNATVADPQGIGRIENDDM